MGVSSAVDPLDAQARRLISVVLQTRVYAELSPARVPAALQVIARHGLAAPMLHALHAALSPERLALVDGARQLSYAAAEAELNAFAAAVAPRLARGGALALVLENRAEYVLAWFAAMRLGVRTLHVGHHATLDELDHFVRTGQAAVLVVSEQTAELARRLRARPDHAHLEVVTVGRQAPSLGERAWAELVTHPAAYPQRLSQGARSVVFTSGTTGRPKGAVRDLGAFGVVEASRVIERLPLRAGERHLVVGPLHHSAPQVFTLLETALGSTLYLHERFDAQAALETLSRARIHSAFMVPTMVRRLVDLPAEVRAANPLRALRALVVGSSPFPEALRRRALALAGVDAVFDFYGATELGWVTLIRGDEMLARPGSVGRALAGQRVRVVDEAGRVVAPGVTGRVEVRNEQTMEGYAGDHAATQATVGAGWSTVDDLGWLDAEGYLYLAGRAREMVKSGGVNVYPAEVEQALLENEAIGEVAVLGLPDADWGEKVVAVVVPRGPHFDPDQARAHARQRLSPAKLPKAFVVVSELPRTPTGKVRKGELRERLLAAAPPES